MGPDLDRAGPAAATAAALPVVLVGSGAPSGLAEMLQQFLEQTLADSPRKLRQARRLAGELSFRAAEDEQVCVRIRFAGDRIELRDGGTAQAAGPRITADFLCIAHLTTGREGPFRLLARRKLAVRFSPLQLPFLLAALRLMRIEPEGRRAGTRAPRRRLAWLSATGAAGGAALVWYLTTHC